MRVTLLSKFAIICSLVFVNISLAASDAFYDIKMPGLTGNTVSFSDFKGKAILMVNTASQCGFTPQLKELQSLHEKYSEKGLVVLGFPSNDFKQETKDDKEIAKFCEFNYGVKFTMFKKSHVNGEKRNPAYQYAVANSDSPSKPIAWNFEKLLIDKNGKVVGRYPSNIKPLDKKLVSAIESELKKR